jgi:uroporphyrin-III C-methyltransferase
VSRRSPGRLWLVGAGPGDPDLLTVAARRLIDQADVVVHDRLVGDAILATVPEGTLRVNVGKVGYHGGTVQGDINAQLIRLVQEGYDVVRLKGGDPFVFGRGGEELLELAAEGIEVRVVPGITAGLAGPAAFGIPATHRGLARSVAFVTGHAVTAPAADEDLGPAAGGLDWDAVARIDTVVVYMGGRTAPAIAARLLAAGRGADTPVAVIASASTPRARIEVLDLAALERGGPRDDRDDAVLLVIGEVVRLHAGAVAALAVRDRSRELARIVGAGETALAVG